MSLVYVLGGNGFIGKNVCSLLALRGRDVVCVGRRAYAELGVNKQQKYVSLTNVKLQDVLQEGAEVIDLSYSTSPCVNSTDFITELHTNVKFSLDVFEACMKKNIKKIVTVSSGGTIYGDHGDTPIQEMFQQKPISSYGVIKSTIEKYAFMYFNAYSLPVCTVRPSNAYGINQQTASGQGFIAAVLENVLKGKEIQIYGDAGNIRDYIHVKDVASGIVSVLEGGMCGEAYNISTSAGASNLDVIRVAERLFNCSSVIKFLPKRPFDVKVNILCNKKIQRQTNWSPTITLEQGIESVIKEL
jgi:UDP-glucose 4-epimerase